MRGVTITLLAIVFGAAGGLLLSSVETANAQSHTVSEQVPPPPPLRREPPLPGAREVAALAATFPHRVERTAVRNGEWALYMDGEWFYWADGRLLPEPLNADPSQFVSIRFYNYELGPWEPRTITPELEARLRDRTRNRRNDERVRFNAFLDTLYEVGSRTEADATMVRVQFLGMGTRVHPIVAAPLERVEARIRREMIDNQEMREFVAGLGSVHGYHWRNIAGTNRRSYHAYGMAVDLLPARWDGRWGYWQWAAAGGAGEWWNLTEDQRWHPPQGIIDAFEAEGFVWGGKWLFFDPVHFEYRPEVLELTRMPVVGAW